MIKKFIERCNENSTKDAFRYLEHKNLKSKTYGELLNDIYKMCNLFNDLGIKDAINTVRGVGYKLNKNW